MERLGVQGRWKVALRTKKGQHNARENGFDEVKWVEETMRSTVGTPLDSHHSVI